MIKIVTVYKSGGDYDPLYVKRLANGIRRNLSLPHKFICLTDKPDLLSKIMGNGDHASQLNYNWPGWWAKMELFNHPGPLLYIDLDTVIVGSLDELANWIVQTPGPLVMLQGFYQKGQCTGIMGWKGDFSWIYRHFRDHFGDNATYEDAKLGPSMLMRRIRYRGDQEWLRKFFYDKFDSVSIVMAQDIMKGIISYKVNVQKNGDLPPDSRIVCFHGKPRPHEVEPMPEWMKKHWIGND